MNSPGYAREPLRDLILDSFDECWLRVDPVTVIELNLILDSLLKR